MTTNEENKKAKVISLINMKGGVGKTTLTVNLALMLSNIKNKKVLVVDIDPQFNTTQSLLKHFGEIDNYFTLIENKKSIVSVFEQRKPSFLHDMNKEKEIVSPIVKLGENISLIPGDLELTNEIDPTRAERLKFFLDEGSIKEYDLVLIDCPPTWSLYSQAALKASDYFMVPSRIDEFSLYGIKILLDKVMDILPSNEKLKCLGVVYTMISETQSKKGINYEQRKNKEIIEAFFTKLKGAKKRIIIEPFTTTTSFFSKLSYKSMVYDEYKTNKKIYKQITDLTDEFLSKL